MTMPNNPTKAMMGGAGLFTRINPYRVPTARPTTNDMSIAFISYSSSLNDVLQSVKQSQPNKVHICRYAEEEEEECEHQLYRAEPR
jgi:hypothetical protein